MRTNSGGNLLEITGSFRRRESAPARLRELSRRGMRSYLRYWCEAFRLPTMSPDEVNRTFDLERDVVSPVVMRHRHREPVAVEVGQPAMEAGRIGGVKGKPGRVLRRAVDDLT